MSQQSKVSTSFLQLSDWKQFSFNQSFQFTRYLVLHLLSCLYFVMWDELWCFSALCFIWMISFHCHKNSTNKNAICSQVLKSVSEKCFVSPRSCLVLLQDPTLMQRPTSDSDNTTIFSSSCHHHHHQWKNWRQGRESMFENICNLQVSLYSGLYILANWNRVVLDTVQWII